MSNNNLLLQKKHINSKIKYHILLFELSSFIWNKCKNISFN